MLMRISRVGNCIPRHCIPRENPESKHDCLFNKDTPPVPRAPEFQTRMLLNTVQGAGRDSHRAALTSAVISSMDMGAAPARATSPDTDNR